jgi:Uma2 family endonuclease
MIAPYQSDLTPTLPTGWYSYLTADEWPTDDEADREWEEVNGVRVEKKMGAKETLLANMLGEALTLFLHGKGLGRSLIGMEFVLPRSGNKRKPDVAYVSFAAWPQGRPLPDEAWWPLAPDLAVEVVSPHELTYATHTKVQEYFAAGVKQVWLVMPHLQHVHVHTGPTTVRILSRADTLTAEGVLPGFAVPVADLFPPAEAEPAPAPAG